MKFGQNVVKEETTQKKYQDEDKKSAINNNKFSERESVIRVHILSEAVYVSHYSEALMTLTAGAVEYTDCISA